MKYRTHEADFGALAKELHGEDPDAVEETDDVDEHDPWSDYSSRSRD